MFPTLAAQPAARFGPDHSEVSPPRSPLHEDRQLGLYDDPDDFDFLQLNIEESTVAAEEDVPEPDSLRSSPEPQPPAEDADRSPSPMDPAETASQATVAIPGVSRREHPTLVHALDLPALPPSLAPRTVYRESHSLWYVRVILLLVAYLHTHHHVTFRASDLTLTTMRALLVALGLIDATDPMPRTLTTTLKRLDLTDKFHVLVECTSCRRLFKPDIVNRELHCFKCNIPLFTITTRSLLVRMLRRDAPTPIPRTVVPVRLLSAALLYLINQPGIETYFEAWTTRTAPPPGEYRSIHDGTRWKTLPGHDGKLFFGPERHGELRVPVIFHADW